MYSDGHSQNQVGFGTKQRRNWYADNIGKSVSFTTHSGVKCGGIIRDVDLDYGEVVLRPYLGKDFSSGRELEILVDEEERVSISAIVVKKIHPENYFGDYLRTTNPAELLRVIPQSEFVKK